MSDHECPECDADLPNDIWKDPAVKEALKSGRSADDIMVIACPKCNRFGYYNEGTSFSCRFCGKRFAVLGEDEPHYGFLPTVRACEAVTLADTVTDPTEGYHNETRKSK